MNTYPIIIVDDDEEDIELMQQAFAGLNIENEIIAFSNGLSFLDFMKTNAGKLFFIVCDINMSPVNGLELKKIIYEDESLRLKCVPFIFFSTGNASSAVMRAYSFGVQGYFIKPQNFEELKHTLLRMVEYWRYSQHPNI